MKLSFDAEDIAKEARFANGVPRQMRGRAWVRVRQVSFDAERMIKLRMPVDTGRARGSWGHAQAPAAPADSIWIEDEARLQIEQGSRVEYIEYLNEGHSRQAPAGFLDVEHEKALQKLEQLLLDDMEALFR